MRKKILLTLSALVFVVCLFAVCISATEVDGIYYSIGEDGENTYAIVNGKNRENCKLETVVIPAEVTIDGVTYKVTSIAENAFGIVNGTPNAYLKHLVIGANVSSVDQHAFRRVTTLQTVKIENTEASGPITFHNAQFMDCTGLVSVEAKNAKIAQYGDYCFWGCTSLETVDFPSMLTRLGNNCFRECGKLTTGDLSNTQITTIAPWVFGSCKSLTSIKFPSTLTSIGNNVFLYCPIEMYVFPHNVTSIGGDTLAHQSKIKVLVMPKIDENHKVNAGFLYTTRPNVIIYSGDNVDYFKGQFSSLSAYDVKKFDEYVPGTTYATNTIFYGANKTCGTCNGLLGEKGFIYKDLLTEMKYGQVCTHCAKENITETYAPVFVDLGYSTYNVGGSCSILQGFKIDYDSVAIYNENFVDAQIGEFGVLAVAAKNVDTVAFDENGEALDGVLDYAIQTGLNYFDIRVIGIPENGMLDENTAYADAKLHMCAYVYVGDTIYYITEGYAGSVLGASVSYNDKVAQ